MASVVRAAVLVTLTCLAGGAVGQGGSESERVVDRARSSVRWLVDFQCPSLGFPPDAKGLESPEQVSAAIQSNWEFASSRIQAIRTVLVTREQVARNLATLKSRPSDSMVRVLEAIDTDIRVTIARVGSALTTWTLANWIEIAQVDPRFAYPTTGTHPLSIHVDRSVKLRSLVQQLERLPGGQEFLSPIPPKFQRCLVIAQNQVVERNSDSIYAAISAAESVASADGISRPYGVVDPSFGGDGAPVPDVIKAQRERVAALREEERRRAEEEARRRAEAERVAREARAAAAARERPAQPFPSPAGNAGSSPQENLRVAAALVDALSSRSVSAALDHMHDDVVMSSPGGQQYGKRQVGNTLQQGFSSGRGASLGSPYLVAGDQVVADVRSQRGSARMVFEFRGGLVSRIRIVR